MRHKRKNKIAKRKIQKECRNLDASFIEWLLEHLLVYRKEAGEIVVLEYHTFTINGEIMTQKECIDTMIQLAQEIQYAQNSFDVESYFEKVDQLLTIFKATFHTLWW